MNYYKCAAYFLIMGKLREFPHPKNAKTNWVKIEEPALWAGGEKQKLKKNLLNRPLC